MEIIRHTDLDRELAWLRKLRDKQLINGHIPCKHHELLGNTTKDDLLQGYLKDLTPYASHREELLADKEKRTLAERYFQLMVDKAIDINSALAYQLGGTVADTYRSTFYKTVPLKIIDQAFADDISNSAKVRNQLTHDYDKLSTKEVVESIKKYFEMYKKYAAIMVEKFIEHTAS